MSTPIWIALIILLVLVVAALTTALTGRLVLRPHDPAGAAPEHPVLLPEEPTAADVERVRLATAVPGYQRDQVDAVLVRLHQALARSEARVAELEAERASAPTFGASAPDPR